ncbi:hypothetical protein M1D68_14920 [Pseudomonas sp. R4-84]
MSTIHTYADAHESASGKRVEVSDEVLAKLATCSSGSLTTQLFKRGFRQPALVGLRAMTRDIKSFVEPKGDGNPCAATKHSGAEPFRNERQCAEIQ